MRRLALVLCSVLILDNLTKSMVMTVICFSALIAERIIKSQNTSVIDAISATSLYFQVIFGMSCIIFAGRDITVGEMSVIIPLAYIGKLSAFIFPFTLCFAFMFIYLAKLWTIKKKVE